MGVFHQTAKVKKWIGKQFEKRKSTEMKLLISPVRSIVWIRIPVCD